MIARGYGGRILLVDVTDGRSRIEPITDEMARGLLGGNGFRPGLRRDRVPPGAAPARDTRPPLAPTSAAPGLLCASPLGRGFPAHMKRPGFAEIGSPGGAPEPVYVK